MYLSVGYSCYRFLIARILQIRGDERGRKKFAEWITQMIDDSIGKLHRWSKADDVIGGMFVQWDEDTRTVITNPNIIIAHRSEDCEKMGVLCAGIKLQSLPSHHQSEALGFGGGQEEHPCGNRRRRG